MVPLGGWLVSGYECSNTRKHSRAAHLAAPAHLVR
jgi:hypothetical protein